MNEQANMVARYEREIPEGYEVRIEGNKVIMELKDIKDTEDEKIRKTLLRCCDDWEKGQFGCMKKEDIASIRAYLERHKEQNLEDIKDNVVRKYMKLDKFALANMLAERDKTNAEVIEAFESIKEQPEQEWSEEDERLLNVIIDILDKEEHNGHLMRGDLKACVKLLKSLRPHWKSSEEQPEVDLESELKKEATKFVHSKEFWSEENPLLSTARHFAEWGVIHLNARK